MLIDRSGGILLTLTDRTYKRSAAGKNGEQLTFERPIQSTGNQLGLSNNSPSASLWLGRRHGHNYFTFPKTSGCRLMEPAVPVTVENGPPTLRCRRLRSAAHRVYPPNLRLPTLSSDHRMTPTVGPILKVNDIKRGTFY